MTQPRGEHPEPEEIAPPIYYPEAWHWIPAPKGKISAHFDWRAEVACKHCGRIPSRAACLNTARWAERLRAEVFGGRPMSVNSWCRCPVYNAEVGGVPGSSHTLAHAIDFTVAGLTVPETYALAAAHQGEGKLIGGLGRYASFVHCDRDRPRRWNGP